LNRSVHFWLAKLNESVHIFRMNQMVQKKENEMKRIAPIALVLAVMSAPAFAFGIDMTMPNLTYPDSTVTAEASLAPVEVPTPADSAPATLSTADAPSN
jgi:hypothetical protein